LRQAQKFVLLLPGERGERIVGGVGLGRQRHMPPIAVKQPNQARVVLKGVYGRQRRGLVVAPEAPSAPEGRQPGRRREARPAQRHDPPAAPEHLVKGRHVVVRRHGFAVSDPSVVVVVKSLKLL
jgi:hypothetical protein